MPEFAEIHHVTLSVTDLDRSAAWYIRLLGFERGQEVADQEGRGKKILLLHPKRLFRLVLVHHPDNHGEPGSEFNTGLDHLAFAVADREELERWRQYLIANAVATSEIKTGLTGELITFRDPDNLQLEMYTVS